MLKRLMVILAIASAACDNTSSGSCPDADLQSLSTTARFAVVTSDFSSSAVALLDAQGELVTEAWIDSGTTSPGIAATLGGDIVLPTVPLGTNQLTLLQRDAGVVSRFDLSSGQVISSIQARAQASFSPNPQDVIVGANETLWVSRFEPNLVPDAPSIDLGNDLLRIDAASGIAQERIGFESIDTMVGDQVVYARPSRMVQATSSMVVVGLARLSADFTTTTTGAVALVNVNDKTVQLLELSPTLRNCGEVVPGIVGGRLFVLCAGDTFASTEEARRSGAGIVELEATNDTTVAIRSTWLAQSDTMAPIPGGALVAVGDGTVVYASRGDLDVQDPEDLVLLNLASGAYAVIAQSNNVFVFGSGSYSVTEDVLRVPSADAGILRFTRDGASFSEASRLNVSPCRRLAPRSLSLLGF